MCKKSFFIFLHFKIFNLNHFQKNKIEPIEPTEPKLDLSGQCFITIIFNYKFLNLKIDLSCRKF